jgi:flagellar motor switch protein FliM
MASILSQEEIDALLEGDDSSGSSNDSSSNNDNTKSVILYDFKRPNRVSKEQLRSIRGLHDKFARGFASKISSLMRIIVEVNLHTVDQMTYGEFLMSLPSPTSFNVLSIKPLDGNIIIEINPTIAFAIIDRMLGGHGTSYDEVREFTEIEYTLLDNAFVHITKELKDAWLGYIEIFPNVETKESSPNVVQVVAQNEFVIMCVLEIIIGNTSGMINICYPIIYLEPIFQRLSNRDLLVGNTKSSKSRNEEVQSILATTSSYLDAILGETNITFSDLFRIGIGDIIKLDKSASLDIDIEINGKKKYHASLGANKHRKTIKIESEITTSKDYIKDMLHNIEIYKQKKLEIVQNELEKEDDY